MPDELKHGLVDCFCASINSFKNHLPLFENLLSNEEIIRANRFHFQDDREKFILCRGLLKQNLSAYLGVNPNEIQFAYTQYGKPYLPNSKLHFNLSHSHEIVIFGVSSCPIGVDVELINHQIEYKSLCQLISPKEDYLAITNTQTFFKYWTCKEALLKGLGVGLTLDLKQIYIDFHDDESISFSTKLNTDMDPWKAVSFAPDPYYLAAIAIKNESVQIRNLNHFSIKNLQDRATLQDNENRLGV